METQKFFALFIVLATSLAINGCAERVDIEAEKANVRALVDKANEAVGNKDWETFRGLISEDYTLGVRPWTSETEKFLEDHVSFGEFVISDITIQVSRDGQMAWAGYKIHEENLFDGNPIEFNGPVTLVFVKKNSDWVLVHAQRPAPD